MRKRNKEIECNEEEVMENILQEL
ncbi:hypothetical protein GLN25_24590, partial [Shigella flexneri]|nr:hypothetical protein [Shigella flexneri]